MLLILQILACSPTNEPPTDLDLGEFRATHPDFSWEEAEPQDARCVFRNRPIPLRGYRMVRVTTNDQTTPTAVMPGIPRAGTRDLPPAPRLLSTDPPVGFDMRSTFQVEPWVGNLDIYRCHVQENGGITWDYLGSVSLDDTDAGMRHPFLGVRSDTQLYNYVSRKKVNFPLKLQVMQ